MPVVCQECNRPVEIGDWPFCPHGPGRDGGLFTHTFVPYLDEHVAHGTDFAKVDGELVQGTWITGPGHRAQVMRDNKSEFKGKKRGMPGQMV